MMGGRTQGGVALITVLLVIALATTVAVQMASYAVRDKRETGHRLALAQAHELALGGERWASSVVFEAARTESSEAGTADDAAKAPDPQRRWPHVLKTSPIEGGQVGGVITDAQGRFNLNSLVRRGRVNAVAVSRFQRLLAVLELDTEIAMATIDWIDRDQERTHPGGAEDSFYLGLADPYRAAQAKMASASELREVRGVDVEDWHKLAPHVSALPRSTLINVNSATAVLLRAIVPGLGERAARQLARADKRFETASAFLADERIAPAEIGHTGLAVESDYFRARIDVELGDITYTLYSWLGRESDGRVRVLRRARTPH